MAMPQRRVREVDQRRAVGWSRVQDLEDRPQIGIQVHDGSGPAFEGEGHLPLIPPPMGGAARQHDRLAGAGVETAALHLDGQGAGGDGTLLVLLVVDVARRPLLMRGQGAAELQGDHAVLVAPPELEDFACMPILEAQGRR